MSYSTVIVTYNQKEAVKRAIESVIKQSILPDEFIILDNNSTDGTIDLLLSYKKKNPIFRIYRSKINLGTCKGINLGVDLAKNSIILNMDHDSELMNRDWVELALKKLDNKRVALVWGTSNKGNFPQFKYANFIGSAILFKKEIYDKVGGFPEDFFIYDNEVDLTVRFYIAGYYPYFFESIDVKHGLTSPKYGVPFHKLRKYIYYDISNRFFIYWKYYPSYLAILLSFLHILKIIKSYMKASEHIIDMFNGIKRFLNNFYRSAYRGRKKLPLKQCFKLCYQQKFPAPLYNLLKRLYR